MAMPVTQAVMSLNNRLNLLLAPDKYCLFEHNHVTIIKSRDKLITMP